MRLYYFLISAFSLALLSCAPATVNNPPAGDTATHGTGLSCFSITPPQEGGPSCDTLCAAKGAVCVGLKMDGARDPGIGCSDPIETSFVAACRCCALAR